MKKQKIEIYDKLINHCLTDNIIKETYDLYIIKDITFKEWVIGMLDEEIELCLKKNVLQNNMRLKLMI